MQWETSHPRDYLHAIRTKVPIELEALSYHSCPFVRARVAVKTTRLHVLEHLSRDREPMVVANVLDNPLCLPQLVETIGIWACGSGDLESIVWYMVKVHRHTPWRIKNLMEYREANRTAQIREGVKLPALPKPPAPPSEMLPEKRKVELILFRLRKPKSKNECWGVVTRAGWLMYSRHSNPKVRLATVKHKHCPVWVMYDLTKNRSSLVRRSACGRLRSMGRKFKQ